MESGSPVSRIRLEVRVEGIVQGVGFRPFAYALAVRLGLGGSVTNDGRGVTLQVEGEQEAVTRFLVALERDAPPLALIERVISHQASLRGTTSFAITPSDIWSDRATLVSPDVATCEDCLRELFDPADRRFRYPFTNCTNCGPRLTIVEGVPYDRAATTMAGFAMCRGCTREYHDPADRRFHAQPVACPACGPRLALLDPDGRALADDPIEGAAELIRTGRVVAVKGLGGYHLAADAASERAVGTLRARKHREEKPFAIMVPDVATARSLVELDATEEHLLVSPQRPIVLLRRRPDNRVAAGVAPGNRSLGLMLPYTPVHHLLMRDLSAPIVLTSGNVSDEPIAYRDDEARERLHAIADAFLAHDRSIHVRTDDSVLRVFRGAPMPVRRARGYAPRPIRVPWPFTRPVLACGAELKSTICLGKGQHAFLSHHLGDLESYEAFRAFTEAVDHFQRLFDVRPEVVACDLHPEYLSTKWAHDQAGVTILHVQHHHAHIASCLADNGETGPVIGVAFDGLGYGTDGTLWGGEFFVADLTTFHRAGHFAPMALAGGVAAIREPWRMAAVYLDEAFGGDVPALPFMQPHGTRWDAVLRIARIGGSSPKTTSVGRLFDAVSALLGVRQQVSYEGQAAIELEQLADPAETASYPISFGEGGGVFHVRGIDLVRAAVDDLVAGVSPPTIAERFHNGVAEAIVGGSQLVRDQTGLDTVALSGGVFQNVLLLDRAVERLQQEGFRVLWHRHVSPNDGGISLGQAVIARSTTTAD
jgi:hydrogenase maturation protein HypF